MKEGGKMATGENFMRIHSARREAEKRERDRVKVDKKTEQKIRFEIVQLQNLRSEIFENDDISEEIADEKGREITIKIDKLIESMY